MALDSLSLTEHVHGHLGWLAAATLVHPAIVLRQAARRAHLAVGISTALVTVAAALGVWLYTPYRQRLRQGIFIHAPAFGYLFERKEHLAFGAVLLAWTGAAAYFAAPSVAGELRERLRTIAFLAFLSSAALAVLVAALGTVVAVYKNFDG